MPQNALAFIANAFSGAITAGRVDQQRALWGAARHGKYYAGVYGLPVIGSKPAQAGSTFRGANQTAASLSAALTTTYTGLCLSNPATSTVNLSVKKVGAIVTNAPAGLLGLGLIAGWLAAGITVHTTPLDATGVLNAYIGAAASGSPPIAGPASQAHLDAACTLVGTPTWTEFLIANSASTNSTSFYADIEESILIPPGGYLAIGGTAANGGFFGSMLWEELSP